MKYDFDNKEYAFKTLGTGALIVVARSPVHGQKRIHLYLQEGVVMQSLGWFRSPEAAALFLDACTKE